MASLSVRAYFVGNINLESVDVRGLSTGRVDVVGVIVLSACIARVGSFGNVVLVLGTKGILQHSAWTRSKYEAILRYEHAKKQAYIAGLEDLVTFQTSGAARAVGPMLRPFCG